LRISDLEQKETHVNKLRNKDWHLTAEKKYGEAVQVYDQVINLLDFLKPKETHINKLQSKGLHLADENKYGEAVQVYDQAINLNPQDARSRIYKGNALREMKKYEE